jgi:hypothetical protein
LNHTAQRKKSQKKKKKLRFNVNKYLRKEHTMTENNTKKDTIIISDKNQINQVDFENHESGQLYEIEGKTFEKKDNQTTAQYKGEDIIGTEFERKADENTIYLGKEVENDFNIMNYLYMLIEGETVLIKDQYGIERHHKKHSGLKDLLDYVDTRFRTYANTCSDIQQLFANQEIKAFFDRIIQQKTKELFFTYLLNPKAFNINTAIRIYMEDSLETVRQRKDLLTQQFVAAEIDIRTYQNTKDIIELCEEGLRKYLAGEIKLYDK